MLDHRTMEPPVTLKDQRIEAETTQRAVAEAMGVSVPTVWNWEAGTAWPSIDKLPALAELLQTDVGRLVDILIATRRKDPDGRIPE